MTESTLIAALVLKDKDFDETEAYLLTHLKCPNCEENKVEHYADCYFCQACREFYDICEHCGDWNGEKTCYYCDPS